MATQAGERRSPAGLLGSVLLHAAVVGAALFTFAHKLDIVQESPPVVPVDLVTIAAKTNLAPTVKARPKEKPKDEAPVSPPEPEKSETPPQQSSPQVSEAQQPEKSEPAPAPKIEPEPAPATPKAAPKPAPVPPTTAAAEPESAKPPPPVPKVRPDVEPDSKPDSAPDEKTATAKAAPKKERFDVNNVLALLDKRAPAKSSPANAKIGKEDVKGFGAQTAMTADLQDALRSQIRKCWSPPVGAPHPQDLVVDFDLLLNRDGSVAQPPHLTGDSTAAVASNPYTRAAAEAARRAIYECAPYKLPADKYVLWREIDPFHFDPRQMMGE